MQAKVRHIQKKEKWKKNEIIKLLLCNQGSWIFWQINVGIGNIFRYKPFNKLSTVNHKKYL